MAKRRAIASSSSNVSQKIGTALLDLVARIPSSSAVKSRTPRSVARSKARIAAAKAAVAAGTCALPPGPLGWLTILPEMLGVWRVQAQLVADISKIYGQPSPLTQEQMIYCLFRHGAAQAVRDLVARTGERFLVRRASVRMMQGIAQQIGVRVTQRSLANAVSRWVPVVGAVGVASYAYYDTVQVAKTAMHLFESGIDVEQAPNNSFKGMPLRGTP